MSEFCTAHDQFKPCRCDKPSAHGDPIWEATVRGELDPPEVDLGYHPGEDH